VNISLGIAASPKDAKKEEDLIKKADTALYYSKRTRNTATAYSPSMEETPKKK
jgi:predicted signal transduction protein with EAL and GGDEF domain